MNLSTLYVFCHTNFNLKNYVMKGTLVVKLFESKSSYIFLSLQCIHVYNSLTNNCIAMIADSVQYHNFI
jgi:hypothetical protein